MVFPFFFCGVYMMFMYDVAFAFWSGMCLHFLPLLFLIRGGVQS